MTKFTPAAFSKLIAPIVAAVTNSPRANPRQLKPSQLLRLVNSTPLGTVLTDTKLRSHRQAAGDRISADGKSVDLVRYTAWLAINRTRTQPISGEPVTATAWRIGPDAYEHKKKTERERQARKSREGRELGEFPSIEDPKRRASAAKSLRVFLETYFAKEFKLEWSDDHLVMIAEAEQKILRGGLKAIAMPRAYGKTTILERAAIWAILYGYRKYVVLIGANKPAAVEMLSTIKTELETNELLAADFPEVCLPIQEVASSPNRCKGQLYQGQRTRIEWNGDRRIVLPTIPGSASSGCVIQCSGILGRVRGMKHTTEWGTIRPDLCLIDDPQTDVSARSQSQIAKRMKVMTAAILGLAGPGGVEITALAPVTVIQPDDMADQILDRDVHPEWDGMRTRMLYGEAKHPELVDQYLELRADALRTGDFDSANAWYRKHQKKIEAGFRAGWPARKSESDVSAIQYCFHLMVKLGKDVFDAEYNNAPHLETSGDEWHVSAVEIAAKVNGVARGILPVWATKLTAFTDVQQRLLYWGVAAFGDNGRGAIIDYGTWPEQRSREFNYKEIHATLAKQYPRRGIEGAIRAGLTDLAELILARDWKREDGNVMRVERWGIDSGNWTKQIHEFVRTHKMAALMMPSKGKGIGPADTPISEWKKKRTEQVGEEWILAPQPAHASRLLTFDTNYWKHQFFLRLATALGDPKDLSLFGKESVIMHRMFAANCHAETFETTHGKGRDVNVFREKPGRPDNHLFDVGVGCVVMTMPENTKKKTKRRRAAVSYL